MTTIEATRSDDRALLGFEPGKGLSHLPALDGLRGLAVVGVVLFHGDWGWARGGFLGVSLFLTLSGFLITSLLIDEFRRNRFVDLTAFWGRRFRRLLPASLLTLLAVTVILISLGEMTGAARLDIWASTFNVANWRFLAAGSSYDDLFAEPSPLRHFWSLAIEEQAYLFMPIVVAIALRFGRRPLRSLALVLGTMWAASAVITFLVSGADRVYYGTDTRAAEILVGALLAVAVAHEPFRRGVALGLWPRAGLQVVGAVALALTLGAWVLIEVDDPIVSGGGLLIVGFLSAALVLSAALGVGPVSRIGSLRPLRYLGRISYGIYLFHWPIFVFASERRTQLGHLPRFLLAVALTVVLAELSHTWFEGPMRRRTLRSARLRPARLAPAAVLVLIAAPLIAPTADSTLGGFDSDRAAAELAESARATDGSEPAELANLPATGTDTAAVPAPTYAVFGDSVALSVAFPLHTWAMSSGLATYIGGDTDVGCGIGRGGKEDGFEVIRRTEFCNSWATRWSAFVTDHRPDVAILQTAQWDLVPRMIPGDGRWRVIGDPVYDRFLHDELLAATDTLAGNGAVVVWLTFPYYASFGDESQPKAMQQSHTRERVDRLNAMVRAVAAERPAVARVVDLADWMSDKVEDPGLRKDGAHFNMTGSDRVATDFVGPELLRTWHEWYEQR